MAEEGGNGIQMSTLGKKGKNAPAWVEDVDAVESCLTEIQHQMTSLKSMHAQRVGSVFGRDLDDMEGRIEKMTQNITDAFRKAERHLQKVGMATKRAGGQEATVGANIQRRCVVSAERSLNFINLQTSSDLFLLPLLLVNKTIISLAKRLQELSMSFRQSQRKYLADVQAQKSGGLVPGSDSRFGIDLNDATTSDTATGEFFTNQAQLAVQDELSEAVKSRDQEIIKIAQSIEELGQIFKELAVLVIDQGTILDRIDYNMEAVVEHTKTGLKQLEKAEQTQKSARPMRCIICLSILIFVLLIILILKHRPR